VSVTAADVPVTAADAAPAQTCSSPPQATGDAAVGADVLVTAAADAGGDADVPVTGASVFIVDAPEVRRGAAQGGDEAQDQLPGTSYTEING
jgi:hypothetical protein